MPNESIIRDSNGNPTHIRVTSDDGRESTIYEYDNSTSSYIFGDHKGKPVEFDKHHENGKTDSYEYDNSMGAYILGDHRGKKKNE